MTNPTDLRSLVQGLTNEQITDLVTSLPPDTAAELARTLGHGTQQHATPLELARHIQLGLAERDHLDYLSRRIRAAVDHVETGTSRRLVVSMPPRSGKTELVSKLTPLWLLQRNPHWRVVLASYDASMATGWAGETRRMIEDHPELGVSLTRDGGASGTWTTTAGGSLFATSVRGALTGRGANCVRGDSEIRCEYGTTRADQAYDLGIEWIMAYDHITERAEWKRVEAAQRSIRSDMVEVTTRNGRVLTCTSDHPIYTSGGYMPAGDLRGGETLVGIALSNGVPMWQTVRHQSSGGPQSNPTRPEPVPQPGMLNGGAESDPDETPLPMRSITPETTSILRRGMPPSVYTVAATHQQQDMFGVRRLVPAKEQTDTALQPLLREHGTLETDDRTRQLAVSTRPVVHAVVPSDAPAGAGAGQHEVRGVWGEPNHHVHAQGDREDPNRAGCAPHQRGCDRQQSDESDHAVRDPSRCAPQVEHDTVSMVRRLRCGSVGVYDFQVEGARNFFAGGVLVHNCLIIDDAVKDFVEAHSQTMRDNLWDWWLSVALTRLEPPYLVAVVGTRWHEDDFIGRLLHPEYEGDPAAWEDISLPAIAEAGDILGRDPGEPLHSPLIEETRGEALQRWADTKTSVGSYAWSALFQARPAPASGAVFDMGWWRYWTTDPSKATDDGRVVCIDPAEYSGAEWVDSWDCAFGEPTGGKHTTGSFVVGQRWMRWGPDRFLIAQQRDRWSFTQTLDAMKRWADSSSPYGHLVHQRLVEAKANGVAIIDQMRNELAGIKPVKPTESKESRARAVTPEIESGNVYIPLPSEADWVQDFLGELRAFPEAQNDDQVDCLSQALQHLRLSGSATVRVPQGRVPRDVASAARTGFRRDLR